MGFSAEVRPPTEWLRIAGAVRPAEGEVVTTRIADDSDSAHRAGPYVAVCKVDGAVRAFRDECPQCGLPVGGGRLDGGLLWCPGCLEPYDVRLGGVGRKRPRLRLMPLALREDGGVVCVALSA